MPPDPMKERERQERAEEARALKRLKEMTDEEVAALGEPPRADAPPVPQQEAPPAEAPSMFRQVEMPADVPEAESVAAPAGQAEPPGFEQRTQDSFTNVQEREVGGEDVPAMLIRIVDLLENMPRDIADELNNG